MIFLRSKFAIVFVLSALLAGALLWLSEVEDEAPPPERQPLGLMTTLPIYWNEAESLDQLLQDDGEVHWARLALEREYDLLPLDTLAESGGLADLEFLLLAQPRVLSPQENVALDAWVRRGGKLLLFADPLLSGESRFHIGDRRRPQDVALLSPILARWGLELEFDEAQLDAMGTISSGGLEIPIKLAGRWKIEDGTSTCALEAAALMTRCGIGEGQVVAVADATLLEREDASTSDIEALDHLTEMAFDSP